MKVGDVVEIGPGQYLGRCLSKVAITAEVIEKYEWSYTKLSSLLVQCKPGSRRFMVNLKHGYVREVAGASPS